MVHKEEKEIKKEQNKLIDILKILKSVIKSSEDILTRLYNPSSIKDYPVQLLNNMTKMYVTKIKHLKNVKDKPYFARIDFKERGHGLKEYYIGKCSIIDDDTIIHVIDWRAPVSGLYYDSRIGETSYIVPDGEIFGNLSLKRLYEIENGVLNSYNDIDVALDDELLKPYLTQKSDVRLKNIISTIQTEQNAIIRANINVPLIVQGVAGSGKTTVALHRIAYLVYEQEKNLKPEDFLIIAPNRFFLDYISNILPDLGVDDIRQETFEEFALSIINQKITVENSYNKLAEIVNNHKSNDNIVIKSSQYKSSLEFKQVIDKYLEKIEEEFIPYQDLKFGDYIVLSYEQLLARFKEYKNVPIYSKFNLLCEWIKLYISNNEDDIYKTIKLQRENEINKISDYLSEDEKSKKRLEVFDKFDVALEKLNNGGKMLVSEYKRLVKKTTPLDYYKQLVMELNRYVSKNVDTEIVDYVVKNYILNKKNKVIEYEDLTPLLYLTNKIYGVENDKTVKHIVIDEAQDYSVFQFTTLKEILNNDSMTILGDISQGILSYRGTNDWKEVNEYVFNNSARMLNLSKSYRTTFEIMDIANRIINKIKDKISVKLAEPVIRHGVEVEITEKNSIDEIKIAVLKRITELEQNGYNNIAIITKTLQETEQLFNELSKTKDIACITDKSEKYKGGISIIPSYLVKGLEFDSVIIANASESDYKLDELDAKLLYVAVTRGMHTLDIYYIKKISQLLVK